MYRCRGFVGLPTTEAAYLCIFGPSPARESQLADDIVAALPASSSRAIELRSTTHSMPIPHAHRSVGHLAPLQIEMPANVFISYDHDDQNQVAGFRGLVANPKHPLDFHDHSLKEPVKDERGRPINLSPSDPRSKAVRDEITKKFEKASRLVVLIGDNTHASAWVTWEIDTFYAMKEKASGDKTWKRIRGMRLKGSDKAKDPPALGGQATETMDWDPKKLDKWLDTDID